MQINIQESGAVVELTPVGRIDQAGAPVFQEALLNHVENCKEGGHAILVDMGGVDFISSVGLRAFMIASKTTRPQKGRILVAGMNDVVREVFQISRFDKVVECHDSLQAAKDAL